MRRVFKTRHFARWSRKAVLMDAALCQAVDEMSNGLIDADLGGNVLKKHVALPGRGKNRRVRCWACRGPERRRSSRTASAMLVAESCGGRPWTS